MSTKQKVLLTGITGFLGSHTAIQLLNQGYQVTGTIRNAKRADEIRQVIAGHTDQIDSLTIVEADLLDAEIWKELTRDMVYIQHIASPFPRKMPKHDKDLIRPAVEGTLNILRAAAENKVKRVVVTSSSGAIVYGKKKNERSGTFTEKDWTDHSKYVDTTPYFRSKTLAERAAWDFVNHSGNALELVTICPGAILGPVLEKDYGTSANIVVKTLDGSSPAVPNIGFDMVDVRSVADLHVRAMVSEKAAGERFIASAGFMSFKNVAEILRKAYPSRKIPKATLPDFATKMIANLEKSLKPILIDLGVERKLDNSKSRELLGWEPIDNAEAVLSCAESVLQRGIVK